MVSHRRQRGVYGSQNESSIGRWSENLGNPIQIRLYPSSCILSIGKTISFCDYALPIHNVILLSHSKRAHFNAKIPCFWSQCKLSEGFNFWAFIFSCVTALSRKVKGVVLTIDRGDISRYQSLVRWFSYPPLVRIGTYWCISARWFHNRS